MFRVPGQPRPHYRAIGERFAAFSADDLTAKRDSIDRAFLEHGITFTVYGDEQGTERIFPLDPFPRIISSDEWRDVERGLIQRITALNLFLHDIYHDAQIVTDGVIPEHVISSATHYQPELKHFAIPGDVYVHICGSDLIRDENGGFVVLEDNLRCPSGVSYVLENRQVMKRAFPRLYRDMGVGPVSHYPQHLLETLRRVAPHGKSGPACVLLTPGVSNSAYFEHTFLAREMGIEIAEGRDLIVLDGRVHMRTTTGLVQVDVIYRRIDDDYIDPTVFREASVLGVPGLENVNKVRICPLHTFGQQLEFFVLKVIPATRLRTYYDLFSNPVCQFGISNPHSRLVIESRAIVCTTSRVDYAALPFGTDFFGLAAGNSDESCHEFLVASKFVPRSPEIWREALDIRGDALDVFQTACKIMNFIFSNRTYQPGVTDSGTDSLHVFRARRGVCQDFAHLMIRYCRALGIAARYVSGHVWDPGHASGHDLMRGAQASHAWVETLIPGHGWIGLDPTNNKIVNDQHVVIAIGRDYEDVAPAHGTFYGGGHHRSMHVMWTSGKPAAAP